MSSFLLFFIRARRKVFRILAQPLWRIRTLILFKAYNINCNKFLTNGVPYVSISNSGSFSIGNDFRMNNNFSANIIGRQQPCIFIINGGKLIVGHNVGVSSLAIVCHKEINIGNDVRIGGNTVIYDTDFHSLNYEERKTIPEVTSNVRKKEIRIGNNVFIGGHTTILKGTVIGDNSIIGAGSVVVGQIPSGEIWAGNPIKFIKKI